MIILGKFRIEQLEISFRMISNIPIGFRSKKKIWQGDFQKIHLMCKKIDSFLEYRKK